MYGDYYPTEYCLGEIIGFGDSASFYDGGCPYNLELSKHDSDVRWYWVKEEQKYATDRLGRDWYIYDVKNDGFSFDEWGDDPVDLSKDAIWWGEGEPPM